MTERNQCDGCAVGAPLNIWDHHQMPDGGRMACTAHLYATPAPAQPEAQEEDSLEWKFSCVIDYARGGKLSKPGWALATIKAAIDEHVNALYEEWSEDQDDDEEPDPLHVANERGEGEPVAWRVSLAGEWQVFLTYGEAERERAEYEADCVDDPDAEHQEPEPLFAHPAAPTSPTP